MKYDDSVSVPLLQTPAETLVVRETTYVAQACAYGGYDYLYSEVRSDGTRALMVQVNRAPMPWDSWVRAFYARVDGLTKDQQPEWWLVHGMSRSATSWYDDTNASSAYAAPTAVEKLVKKISAAALHALCWDI